jgi:hypothetical protein
MFAEQRAAVDETWCRRLLDEVPISRVQLIRLLEAGATMEDAYAACVREAYRRPWYVRFLSRQLRS